MSVSESVFPSVMRPMGLLLIFGGSLVVVAGLLYWAMGWRYDSTIALWAAAWGLPFIALGTGLVWMTRRPAGLAAIICGGLSLRLLTLDGFVLWAWLPGITAVAAIALGFVILIVNRRAAT